MFGMVQDYAHAKFIDALYLGNVDEKSPWDVLTIEQNTNSVRNCQIWLHLIYINELGLQR